MKTMEDIYFYINIVSNIVLIASLIAPFTKTKKDDALMAKLKPIIDMLSLNKLGR